MNILPTSVRTGLLASAAFAFALGVGAVAAQEAAPAENATEAPAANDNQAPAEAEGIPTLTEAELEEANKIYFERCAGCHSV